MTNQIKNLAQQLLSTLETRNLYLEQFLSDEMLLNSDKPEEFLSLTDNIGDKINFTLSLFEFSLICLSVYKYPYYRSSNFILNCLTRFLKKSDEELSECRIENSNIVKSKTEINTLENLNKLEFIFWLLALATPQFKSFSSVKEYLDLIINRNNEAKTPILNFEKTVFIQQKTNETLKLKDAFFYWNAPHQNHTLSPYYLLGLDIYTPDSNLNLFKYDKNGQQRAYKTNSSINILDAFKFYKKAIQIDTKDLSSKEIKHLLNLAQIHDQFNNIFPVYPIASTTWNKLTLFDYMMSDDESSEKTEKWIDITNSMKIKPENLNSDEFLSLYDFDAPNNYLFFALSFYLNIAPNKEAIFFDIEKLKYEPLELNKFFLFALENENVYKRFLQKYSFDFFKKIHKDIHEKENVRENFTAWFEDSFEQFLAYGKSIINSQDIYNIPKNNNGLFEFELQTLKNFDGATKKNSTTITLIENLGFEKLQKKINERKGNDEFKNIEMLFKKIQEKEPLVIQNGLHRELATLENVQEEKKIFLKEMFPHMNEITDFIFEQMNLSKLGNNAIQFPPILLNGPAGTGKTFFFKTFSELLSLNINFINSPSINASWAITGLEPSWATACPGLIFETLINSSTANPIILLDEIDKISKGEKYGQVEDVLLGLFEKHSATEFKDSFVPDLKMDASHIIWVCTSNNISKISEPMKSRLKIFEVPIPNKIALKQLGKNIYHTLKKNNHWGSFFDNEIPEETLELLVTNEGSIRDMRKYIEFAFARAANENSSKILPQHLKIKQMPLASQLWHRKLES